MLLTRTLRPLILRNRTAIMSSSNSVHNVAAKGFGEGTNDHYDKARPSYPPPALERIASLLPSDPLTIIEVGAGTGIFTRLLLSPPAGYPKFNIKELVAVEPSKGMRTTFEKSCGPNAKIVDGGFDDLSKTKLGAESADLVVIAQAWHWCPDHQKALVSGSSEEG